MLYLSVCSGIEAATVAWKPLGWKASAFSDIDPFSRDLLKYHYPSTPLHGDFRTIGEKDYGAINLLVGGTPCQAFSVAGLRKGFGDDRGNLTLAFLQLLKRKRPKWVVWENVPGVLSHDKGRTFGAFLGGLGQCGYGFAYRVLNAQYFGVPQRRKRVFVIGCLGDWRSPAKVLFEPEGLSGNITAKCLTARGAGGQNLDQDTANFITIPINTMTMMGRPSDDLKPRMGSGIGKNVDPCPTITKGHSHAVAFTKNDGGRDMKKKYSIRRLTPIECERLQGFPDNYTNIPGAKDGKRYAAIGNSMAVPVMAWLGSRINIIDLLT